MKEENLKGKFRQLLEDGFAPPPSFESMTGRTVKAKKGAMPRWLCYAAAVLLLGIIPLIWPDGKAVQTKTSLSAWKAPTTGLLKPNQTSTKLYNWHSPTDFLLPKK